MSASKTKEVIKQLPAHMAYWLIARRSKIVLCTGMPRSGSTWLFNAVRLLLQSEAAEVCSYWKGDFDALKFLRSAGPEKILLLKIHRHSPVLEKKAAVIFYSIRDIRDVIASKIRRGDGNFMRIIEKRI